MSDTCGPTSGMPFAQFDREERCWKTSEVTSLWALTLSSLTLPKWGGLHDGVLYEHPTPAPPTIGRGSSSMLDTPDTMPEAPNKGSNRRAQPAGLLNQVAALPTPTADNHRGLPNTGDFNSLPNTILNLPTPRATSAMDDPLDTTNSMLQQRGRMKYRLEETISTLPTPRAQNGEPRNQTIYAREGPQNLENALALLPTPAVNDMGAGKDPQEWADWAANQKAADGRSAPHGKSLEQEALKVGAITSLPLSDGSSSSGEPHQPQLFNEQDVTA